MLDDRKGSVGQAKGVAEALGERMRVVEKQLVYNRWGGLPNWLRGRSLFGIDKAKSDNIDKDWPEVVMSTSRRTVPVARYIRKKSQNKTKIVQLMYPDGGVGLREMAFAAVPQHDEAKKLAPSNVLKIVGAPTRIFPEVLKREKARWEKEFADLPKPLTAVIVGGAIKGKEWPLENAENLARKVRQIWQTVGGSILITTSRRTGEKAQKLIVDELKGIPAYTYMWGEKKENPLLGFYACAERIITTADSVSMCSEACGTGVPVLLFVGKNWLGKKHLKFAQSLTDGGYAVGIDDEKALDFKPRGTLNCAYEIAEAILQLK